MLSIDAMPSGQRSSQAGPSSQWVTGLASQLKEVTDRQDVPWQLMQGRLQTARTANSFWIVYELDGGTKLALRACYDPQTLLAVKQAKKTTTSVEYTIKGSLGPFRVRLELLSKDPLLLRCTTSLEPKQSFHVQAFPRDLYVLDKNGDPSSAQGQVHVTQSGPTAGLAYLSLTQPSVGSVLYFQNLSALSDYCQMTHSDPSGSIAAEWPEIGFALPASEQPLQAGQTVVLSDAFIQPSAVLPQTEFDVADRFLEAMACVYQHLPKPQTTYYDWPGVAQKTIQALTHAPDCSRTIRNHFYVNAYVNSTEKPPESMVQLAILVPLWEYQEWLNKPVPLVDQLLESVHTFFDEHQSTLVRWLPGEDFQKEEPSEEEDHHKMDSWYLLHILMNLGRLAHQGNHQAKELLLRSVDYVIRAAHRFDYAWPVFYDMRDLSVVKAETAEGQGGEFDVAGLYTHVMLQVYDLTKETHFLEEAKRSADRLLGKGFSLLYQSNITTMSALSLLKLWKLTGNRLYFDMSKLCMANVVSHLWIWECDFGFGQHRSTFMGLAPLRDCAYLAAYEEAEIYATLHNYLKEFDQDIPASIRLLVCEYMKYLLHRGRYYYPTELTPEMISQEPREGRILADLPIPLEGISTGWTQAGTVGQEVYGGALAYILTTYSYKRFSDVPVAMYSEYPIYTSDYQMIDKDSGFAVYQLGGTAQGGCRIRLLAQSRQLPMVRLSDEDGDVNEPFSPTESGKDFQEYHVPGNMRLRVDWSKP